VTDLLLSRLAGNWPGLLTAWRSTSAALLAPWLLRGALTSRARHPWGPLAGRSWGPLARRSVRSRKLPAGRRTSRGVFTAGLLWKLLRGGSQRSCCQNCSGYQRYASKHRVSPPLLVPGLVITPATRLRSGSRHLPMQERDLMEQNVKWRDPSVSGTGERSCAFLKQIVETSND
jgi:hypothetical protein